MSANTTNTSRYAVYYSSGPLDKVFPSPSDVEDYVDSRTRVKFKILFEKYRKVIDSTFSKSKDLSDIGITQFKPITH